MELLKVMTILVTFLTLTNAGYRRHFKQPPPPTLFPTKVPEFPKDMRPDAINRLKVPSKEFCDKVDIQPAYHYVVLPWWFHHCQAMKDANHVKDDRRLPNLGHFRRILEEAQQYRKRFGDDASLVKKRHAAAHEKRL